MRKPIGEATAGNTIQFGGEYLLMTSIVEDKGGARLFRRDGTSVVLQCDQFVETDILENERIAGCPIEVVGVGQIFQLDGGNYLMKTNMHETGWPFDEGSFLCVSKEGRLTVVSREAFVEVNIPWTEQVDGFRTLYNHLKSLFPIKPQALYDSIKAEEG